MGGVGGGGRGAKSESVWVAVVFVLVTVTVSVAGDDPSSDRVKCGIASEGTKAGLRSPSSGCCCITAITVEAARLLYVLIYRQEEQEHFCVKKYHGFFVSPFTSPAF